MKGSLFLLFASVAFGQRFEVASVKPCPANTPRTTNTGTTSRGGVNFTCNELTTYIRMAYINGSSDLSARLTRLEGGPPWIHTDLFQIVAKAPAGGNALKDESAMLQALLEDRFHLKLHRETRQVPVYALTVAKSGFKAPSAKTACFTWTPGTPPPFTPGQPPPAICGRGQLQRDGTGAQVKGSTLADFATALSLMPFGRRVIDKTGIAGRYDFDLKWLPPEPGTRRTPDDVVTDLQGALHKFGLQLVDAKGPGEFLIVDHAEKPTAN